MSGNGNGNGNRWLQPGVLFGVVGMAGAIMAAWISFSDRLTAVETSYRDTDRRLERMENKIDRLIERRIGD